MNFVGVLVLVIWHRIEEFVVYAILYEVVYELVCYYFFLILWKGAHGALLSSHWKVKEFEIFSLALSSSANSGWQPERLLEVHYLSVGLLEINWMEYCTIIYLVFRCGHEPEDSFL